jgi:metal-responsive CopG/Arc/MetJ family transcriptional regulator
MKMQRMMIQLPASLKAKLDALRKQGTTASGFIRNLLEQHFKVKWAA